MRHDTDCWQTLSSPSRTQSKHSDYALTSLSLYKTGNRRMIQRITIDCDFPVFKVHPEFWEEFSRPPGPGSSWGSLRYIVRHITRCKLKSWEVESRCVHLEFPSSVAALIRCSCLGHINLSVRFQPRNCNREIASDYVGHFLHYYSPRCRRMVPDVAGETSPSGNPFKPL